MKKIFIGINLFISLILMTSFFCKHNVNVVPFNPYLTTLDSIQGDWFDVNDSSYSLKIRNRIWVSEKKDSGILRKLSTRMIYFSDTIINENINDISKIDTSKQTGSYMVTFDQVNNLIFCYYINGFTFYNRDTTFSISPAHNFKAEYTRAFQKFQ